MWAEGYAVSGRWLSALIIVLTGRSTGTIAISIEVRDRNAYLDQCWWSVRAASCRHAKQSGRGLCANRGTGSVDAGGRHASVLMPTTAELGLSPCACL